MKEILSVGGAGQARGRAGLAACRPAAPTTDRLARHPRRPWRSAGLALLLASLTLAAPLRGPDNAAELRVSGLELTGTGLALHVECPASFTRALDIYVSTNTPAGPWRIVATLPAPVAGVPFVWHDEAARTLPFGFYTVGDAETDTDGDTLADARELLLHGTSPATPDTDADGLPDGWETAYGLDPNRDDAAADPDGDGLSNLLEYQRGRHPRAPALPDAESRLGLEVWTPLEPGE